MSGWNVGLALPEWILAGSVLAALAADARGMGEWVRRLAWFGVFAATATAALQGLLRLDDGTRLYAFHGRYGLDAFAVVFKILFGATSLFILAMSGQWLRRVDRGHGEFRLLALMATLGMFFACSVEDFASLFVSLELITVCFYCLAAFKRNDERSVEAGIKYVILGGLASAFLLLGIAFIYGATGSLEIRALAAQADDLGHGGASLLQFGVLLAIVGLAFKIAAVPFQVWTPDVYEGAASPVTAFLSMGSKAAGFVLLLKVVRACLGPSADAGLADPDAVRWLALVAVMAGTTLLYGNLGAMWQGNIKRLLGYSSIGHAGYALMGVFALSEAGFAAVVYYLMAYLFTVLGVFAVIILVNGAMKSHRIDDYSGLGRRSPFLALVLTVGLLSLAGVPPLGGFFGKFLIFQAVVAKGTTLAYALAFVGAAGVVISLYYYLCVVKRIYMHEPGPDAPETIAVPGSMKIVLWTCLIGMFVLGIFMGPFVKLAQEAAHALVAAR
ncbi:MAG TPA: NADH-quinone oxidoreductase subunit N [Planctomycetota bacterium]|nr:NADH-quinone oxidoreductase subunit N [Planctomycetota bacterium]